MRRTWTGGVVALAMALGLAAAVPTTAWAAVGPVVPASQFGMTQNRLAGTAEVGTGFGSMRLWDIGARWNEVNTASGVFDWTVLDAAVDRARAAGYTDLMYTIGATPRWAAKYPTSAGLYGRGSASSPADYRYYTRFLAALLNRYAGKITSYQVWNESNLPTFFNGTASQLATLTMNARKTINAFNAAHPTLRPVKLIGPSWLLRYWHTQRYAQMAALKAVGWPVDAVSVHSYPFATDGPDARVKMLLAFRSKLAYYGGRKAIWDTEVNFGDRRPGYTRVVYTGGTAARLAARAYIDSLRYGIARTYWYSWDTHILGIDLTATTGAPTAAGIALRTLKGWVTSLHWNGCTTASNGITRCALTTATGAKRTVIYTYGSSVRTVVPSGARTACTLTGACRTITPGTNIYATNSPQFLIGG